jgi:benzoyl-CoA reductase subunit C
MMEALIRECEEIIRDIDFKRVRSYKEKTGEKVVAYFPVYTPMEILHSLKILPLGLHGAGNEIEILYADARFGSFICSIVKSTMELGLSGRLDFLDGFIFTGICDAARNLSFVYRRNFKDKLIIFLHLPQNPETEAAIDFLEGEFERLVKRLEDLTGNTFSEDALRESIRLYNENRRLQRELYQIRREDPGRLKTHELYTLVRVGNFIRIEEHNRLMREAMESIKTRPPIERDRIRVLVEGSFCEQPPFELLKLLDEMGCHIVDDDFVLGRRFIVEDVREDLPPLRALAEAYVKKTTYASVKHMGKKKKSQWFMEKVKKFAPEAVIFMYAKFCEPGLFDYVLFKKALEKEGIPHLFIEFEEKMWNFDRVQLEIETFFESLIFA